MSDRLSRKQIKRDELRVAVEKTVDYATSHTRMILYAVVAAVGLAALAVGLIFYFQGQARKAARALDRAMGVYGAEIEPGDPRPDDPEAPTFADEASRKARARELLTAVQDDFSGSHAAAVAAAYLGRLAAEAGDLAAARQHWQKAAEEARDRLLAAEVRLNLLRLDRAEGKPEEVAEGLEAMLLLTERPLPEDLILFHLAEVREELGLKQEALAAYQRIIDEFPSSPYSAEARQKLDALQGA